MKEKISLAVVALSIIGLLGVSAPVSAHEMEPPTREVSPAHVVRNNGEYSDVRFIDITVPHHIMAIEMAKVEVEKGTKPELKAMAQQMIDEQTKEIADLKQIRLEITGSVETPTQMNPHQMRNSGMPTPEELAASDNVDLAFIDAMVPHHASLIPMANTVLVNSDNDKLKEMARMMINSQAMQIGQLTEWREAWYPGVVEPPYAQ